MPSKHEQHRIQRKLKRVEKKAKKYGYTDVPMSVQTLPEGNATCALGGFKLSHGDDDAVYLCHPNGGGPSAEMLPARNEQQMQAKLNKALHLPVNKNAPVAAPEQMTVVAPAPMVQEQSGQPVTLGQMLLAKLGYPRR